MMTLYLVCMILATVALASVVPLIQYLVCIKKKQTAKDGFYIFSRELFDRDTDNSAVKRNNSVAVVNRVELSNRGWVRCPNGSIMNAQEFEEKKQAEYLIDLP